MAKITTGPPASGGGSTPGASIVRKFPFAFNSAGLATGFTIYVPTIGDVLLDAWIEIDTAWDGTTPFGDIGSFKAPGIGGLFGVVNGVIDMTQADQDTSTIGQLGGGLLIQQNAQPQKITDLLSGNIFGGAPAFSTRYVPGKFLTTDPFKVVVSQDGTSTGGSPGAAHGAGVVYLVTATPA